MDVFLALQILYDLTLLLCCGAAICWGGRPERIGAAIMLVGSALTVVSALLPGFDWAGARLGVVAIDVGVLALLLLLALRSDRFWPIWMTSFHLITVSTHLVVLAGAASMIQAYVLLQGFWAYPMLGTLLAGTLAYRRRIRAPVRKP